MTYISDLHNYSDEAAQAEGERVMDDSRRKRLKSEIEEIVNGEFDRLAEYAGNFLSETAADRAQQFLLKVLQGDESAILSLVSGTDSTRYREGGCDPGQPWASVIHGTIFETNAITLRRQIVEANADLLSNERIKDLESIVAGLIQQLAKLQSDLETTRARL